jgi:hypothetical protein
VEQPTLTTTGKLVLAFALFSPTDLSLLCVLATSHETPIVAVAPETSTQVICAFL